MCTSTRIPGRFLALCALILTLFTLPTLADARRFAVVREFNGPNGANPATGLIMDRAGNLIGTTPHGGDPACTSGCGIVYKLRPGGHEEVLHDFSGPEDDGTWPSGNLVQDTHGNFFGVTYGGGRGTCNYGCGIVFRLKSNGEETVVYSLYGGTDGAYPDAGLIADGKGNLYGVTQGGGGSVNCSGGCGTVFRVTHNGSERVLHAFQSGNDGEWPYAAVIADRAGDLYGTTFLGGGGDCTYFGNYGCGTIYKVTRNGTETIMHAFQGGSDGAYPYAGLIADEAGNLYGTTFMGGMGGSCWQCGTIFEITPNGIEKVLYSFQGGSDGRNPYAGLLRDKKGNLYGTTQSGGANCNCGTIFVLASNGTEKVLYSFKGKNRGANPDGNLVLDKSGYLYGTTIDGGDKRCDLYGSQCGVIFKFKK